MDTLGLYIHIPFCKRKCFYCDFASYPEKISDADIYIEAVLKEAQLQYSYITEHNVDNIFIGGGTPSILSSGQVEKLITGLRNITNLDAEEFTIEANPETLDLKKIRMYKELGINRISIGLQSHDNDILAVIGRCHTYEDFIKAYELADKYIGNINVDTIFGLPGQSAENYKETLRRVIELKPGHISCYALKLEEGTKLFKTFKGTDEEIDRRMYHNAADELTKAGYSHYETSNFAKEGFECRHNLKYWEGKEYLGIGAAASSFDIVSRRTNTSDLSEYISIVNGGRLPVDFESVLSEKDKECEYIMLRLRLAKGISINDYNKSFKKDFVSEYSEAITSAKKEGLITFKNGVIRPTLKGFDLQNYLITEFMKKM